jgi:hypothetical protein
MSEPPRIAHTFEFLFKSGIKEFVTAEEPRDRVEWHLDRVEVVTIHEDGVVDTFTAYKQDVAAYRHAKRIVNTDAEQVQQLEAGELAQA